MEMNDRFENPRILIKHIVTFSLSPIITNSEHELIQSMRRLHVIAVRASIEVPPQSVIDMLATMITTANPGLSAEWTPYPPNAYQLQQQQLRWDNRNNVKIDELHGYVQ